MASGAARAADMPDHVPGRLLAVPHRGVDAVRVNRTLLLHGVKLHQTVPELNLDVIDVPEEARDGVAQSLRQSGLFDVVEPDYYARLAATTVPNDPSYGSQWHLPKISAPQAWALNTGASSLVIAVIDSGADGTHPDLAPRLIPGWNFVNNSADTTDVVGHGTAVAGTVGAATNNNTGVAGVNWNSKIMPLVVVDANEFASYSNIATAIQYAVDHGASVINISIGGTGSSAILQSAVDYAWSHNVVIFASAMNNSNSTPNYPAACNHAVAVSSTDSSDNLSTFSNYGSWIAISAPGSNILTTSVGGGYGYWAGTSFSSPIATAVASLALSVNPSLTASALVSLLEQNTDDLGTPGFDNYFGWGRVNAYKVVQAAQPAGVVSSAPQTVTLNAGQTQQFTSNTSVTWSATIGSISSTGLYSAPGSVTTTQTATITATASGGAHATSTVTLVPVTAAPASVSLTAGQTQQFTSNTSVTWTATVGSISSSGLYTAPATVTTTQTATVTALAVGGATATATVTLTPITVSPATASLYAGQTRQFTSNTTVVWSATIGSISSAGLYTAPATVGTAQTSTITARTSSGGTATATVTLTPITVAPGTVSLYAGQTQQFSSNTSVTWSATVGAISATGLYTAPGTVTTTQTATVTATAAGGGASTATVTLTPITVTPAAVNLNAAQTQQFTSNTSVTWSATVGTISSTGLYTAPSTVTSAQTVTVTAKAASGATAAAIATLVPVNITASPATVTVNAGQTQQFSTSVTGTGNTAVTWAISPVVGTISSTGLYTAPSSVSSTQTITVTATGATGATGIATLTVKGSVSITGAFSPIRVNAGGPSYVDTLGQTWAADNSYTGGSTWSTNVVISGNTAPTVYLTCRYGVFGYAFAAPNGSYTVNLKFSEPSLGGAGQRLFNTAINGATVLTNFDVYAAAGGMNKAVDRSFPVNVTNGQISIQFIQGSADWPMVSGIEIVQATSTFTPIRVNGGGAAYTDTIGQVWAADSGFSGGNTWNTASTISGTTSPGVYQTCRYGVFNYAFNVPNGSYKVNLKFAEISLGGPGQRLFNVGINGTAVLTNFDIYAAAGGMNIAVDRSFPVTVTNGQIGIQFTQGSTNWPLINGIEIVTSATTGALPTIRVNASGPAYTDSKNQSWAADSAFTGGYTWSVTGAINNTADPTLYQSSRWGAFSYAWAVPNGTYTVNLKFAEISRSAPGQRVFNVSINGTAALTNFDIVAAAGAPSTAIDKPFQVSVTNGQIFIQFTRGSADQPLVNAIEIVPAATTGSVPKMQSTTDPKKGVLRRTN